MASPPPPGEARVGPGAYLDGVLPRFSLRCRRRARLQGRRRAEAERHRGGRRLSPREARVAAFTAEGAQCCMGVARRKPSDAGESAASPYRATPGSGREPTRMGSCPSSAYAAEGAPGCIDVVRQMPSYAGEGAASPHQGEARFRQCLGRAGSPLGWDPVKIQPARPKASQAARASTDQSWGGCSPSPPGEERVGSGAHSGVVRPRFSQRGRGRARRHWRRQPGQRNAGEGAASPHRVKAGSGRKPTRVGSGPGSACASEGAQCC